MKTYLFLLCILSIVDFLSAMDNNKVSFTKEYLELACIVDYVKPFSILPVEIKNKIAQYCVPINFPTITEDYISDMPGALFTHLISGNLLIGRSQSGQFTMFDIGKKEKKGPYPIKFFEGDFNDADSKLCQRMSSMADGTILIGQRPARNWMFYSNGVLTTGRYFPFKGELICHQQLPYFGYITKTQDISKVLYTNKNIQKYANQYSIAIHRNEVFEDNIRSDISPFLKKTINVDHDLSKYPLLWHPTELKFLYKNKTCLGEYDAYSGRRLRSFKILKVSTGINVKELSFCPYHVAYVEGGEYCAVVCKGQLYALHDANGPSQRLQVNGLVHGILGINQKGNLILLETSESDKRYVGIYNLRDNTIVSLLTVPLGKRTVIFDPATATIVAVEERKSDTIANELPLYQQCIRRMKIKDMGVAAVNFTLRHLMVYYAQNQIKTAEDRVFLNDVRYNKSLSEMDMCWSTW